MILPPYEDTSPPAGTMKAITRILRLNKLAAVLKGSDKNQPIAIIGVHGWQPKILQNIVKLDSGLFCAKMAEAVRQKLGLGPNEGDITSIPLNGYGTVLKRRDDFLKQIQANQTTSEKLKNAKILYVVGHSQGVPVSVFLLQKLIEVGLVNPNQQKICACLMAGISQGPISRFDPAGKLAEAIDDDQTEEMFEFQKSSSSISQAYRDATANILKGGVKIVYFASGNDEAVPLHSALYSHMSHPSIKRGIYVATTVYEEKRFIVDLVRILIRIRNNDYSDHGLLNLLSDSLIGYLIDKGHSDLHNEPEAYQYAVDHLTKSKDNKDVDIKFTEFDYSLPEKPHRTYVPWAMRGLLSDEEVIITEKLMPDLKSLRQVYKTWSPNPTDLVAAELKCDLEPFGDDTEEKYIEKEIADKLN
ncbi:13285_t:CDS:2 [Ambispora leptoticha]|uniref:13285_t:CDS:1 n=1 Tax=Ambispora leptoticha TaxID=144679 RepID=A0A9N9EWI5_9GLOM|nr:13285_t:CDS:2 [Ambispora leptoticha]